MNQLVMDVGMFDGSDTHAYLRQGYNVVAVEANPDLVMNAKRRFGWEISDARLRIVNAAVADHDGTATLSIPDDGEACATLDHMHLERSVTLRTRPYRTVEVPARTFASILEEYGIPHYLKVDIESSDMLCVEALRDFNERPAFLSIESHLGYRGFIAVIDELAALYDLGYKRFCYVDQSHNPPLCSGPFGDDLTAWLPIGEAHWFAFAVHYAQRVREHLHRPLTSWWDLHARRD